MLWVAKRQVWMPGWCKTSKAVPFLRMLLVVIRVLVFPLRLDMG